jgi:ferredoxin
MKIILQDKEWKAIWECAAVADKSILDTLSDNDIQIPYSCKMWVCGVCLCNIVAWWEHILKKDVMPTEDNMCLACTAFVNDVDAEWEIILQLI